MRKLHDDTVSPERFARLTHETADGRRFKCGDCGRWRSAAQGAAGDPRCDLCVVAEFAGHDADAAQWAMLRKHAPESHHYHLSNP
jgi:hypothetical protein